MENTICLDTDFLVDFLRKKEDTIKWIKENEEEYHLSTTIINVFELYCGAYKSSQKENNLKTIEELLNKLDILEITKEIAKIAGEQAAILEKEGNMLEFRDILIAAIALSNNYLLKTNSESPHSKLLPAGKSAAAEWGIRRN